MAPPFQNKTFVYHFYPPEHYIHLHEWEQLDRGTLSPHTALPLHPTVCTALQIPHLPPPIPPPKAFAEPAGLSLDNSVPSLEPASPEKASTGTASPKTASTETASTEATSPESMAHCHSHSKRLDGPAPPSSESPSESITSPSPDQQEPNDPHQATVQRHVAAEEAPRRVSELYHPHPSRPSHHRQNPESHQPAGQHSQRSQQDHEHRQATPHYEPFPQSGNVWQFKLPPRVNYPFDWEDPDSRGLPKHPNDGNPDDGQGQQPDQPRPGDPRNNQDRQHAFKRQVQPSAAQGFFYTGDPKVHENPADHHKCDYHENPQHDTILDKAPHQNFSQSHRGRKHHGDKARRPADYPGKEKEAQQGGRPEEKQPDQPGQAGNNPGGNQEPDPRQELLNRGQHRRSHGRKPAQRDRSKDPQERKDGRHGDKQPGQPDEEQPQKPIENRQGGNNGGVPGEEDAPGGHQGGESNDNKGDQKVQGWPDKNKQAVRLQGWRDDHRGNSRDRREYQREDSDSEDSRPSRPSPGSENRSPRPSRPPQNGSAAPHDEHQNSARPIPPHLNPRLSDTVQQWIEPIEFENHHYPQDFGHPHRSSDCSEGSDCECEGRNPQRELWKDKQGSKDDGSHRWHIPKRDSAPRVRQGYDGKHGPHEDSGSSHSDSYGDRGHELEKRQDAQDSSGRRQRKLHDVEDSRGPRDQKPERIPDVEDGRSCRKTGSRENHHAEEYHGRREPGKKERRYAEDGSGRKHPGLEEDHHDAKDDRGHKQTRPEDRQPKASHGRKNRESGEDYEAEYGRSGKHRGSEEDQHADNGRGHRNPGSKQPSSPFPSTPSSLSAEREYHQYARNQLRQIPPPSNSADDREKAMGDRVYSMGELKELFALKAGINNKDFDRVHEKLEELISAVKQLNPQEYEEDLLDTLAEKLRVKSGAGELAGRESLESIHARMDRLSEQEYTDMWLVRLKMKEMEKQIAQIREEKLSKEGLEIVDPAIQSYYAHVSNRHGQVNEGHKPGDPKHDPTKDQGGNVEDPQQRKASKHMESLEGKTDNVYAEYNYELCKTVHDHILFYDQRGPAAESLLEKLLIQDSNGGLTINTENLLKMRQQIRQCVQEHLEVSKAQRPEKLTCEKLLDVVLDKRFAEYELNLRKPVVEHVEFLRRKMREEPSKNPEEEYSLDPHQEPSDDSEEGSTVEPREPEGSESSEDEFSEEPHQEAIRHVHGRWSQNPRHDLQQREDSLRADEAQRRLQRRKQERQQQEESEKRRREAAARPPERPLDDWERHQKQREEEEERRRKAEEDKKKRGGFMGNIMDHFVGYVFALGTAVFVLGQNGGLDPVTRNL